jgi:hypothetical protein
MKNTLAENMLRFGVKNLSESNIKKINEASINEDDTRDVNLKGDPRLPKVAKSLGDQWRAGTKLPAEAMGPYIFIMPRNGQAAGTEGSGDWNSGFILSFWTYDFGSAGRVVGLQNWPSGFGGTFNLETKLKQFGDVVKFNSQNSNSGQVSPAGVAEYLNLINQIPMNIVNAAWTANTYKANFAKTMVAYAASPVGRQVMSMLQGNAKAFYTSMITTPAAPATAAPTAAKPGATPVKKP